MRLSDILRFTLLNGVLSLSACGFSLQPDDAACAPTQVSTGDAVLEASGTVSWVDGRTVVTCPLPSSVTMQGSDFSGSAPGYFCSFKLNGPLSVDVHMRRVNYGNESAQSFHVTLNLYDAPSWPVATSVAVPGHAFWTEVLPDGGLDTIDCLDTQTVEVAPDDDRDRCRLTAAAAVVRRAVGSTLSAPDVATPDFERDIDVEVDADAPAGKISLRATLVLREASLGVAKVCADDGRW